jgi:hypothetical protein
MNVIDSNSLERDRQISLRNLRELDCVGKPVPGFPLPARGVRPRRSVPERRDKSAHDIKKPVDRFSPADAVPSVGIDPLERFPIRWNRKETLRLCFIAFSRREAVSASLENAGGDDIRKSPKASPHAPRRGFLFPSGEPARRQGRASARSLRPWSIERYSSLPPIGQGGTARDLLETLSARAAKSRTSDAEGRAAGPDLRRNSSPVQAYSTTTL